MSVQSNSVSRLCASVCALSLLAAPSALAAPIELSLGEAEIVSKRFDGPLSSRALDGNSRVSSVSPDGRYIAFSNEGSLSGAPRRELPRQLVFDRQNNTTELIDPAPQWSTHSVILHQDSRYLTFASNSPALAPGALDDREPVNFGGGADAFILDRLTKNVERLTTGYGVLGLRMLDNDSSLLLYDRKTFRSGEYASAPESAGGWAILNIDDRTIEPLFPEQRWFEQPERLLSNDQGDVFGYQRQREGTNLTELIVWNRTTGERKVIEAVSSPQIFRLSPDGRTAVYSSRNADGQQMLFLYDRASENTTTLLPQANANIDDARYIRNGEGLLLESSATNLTGEFDPNGSNVDLFEYQIASGLVARIGRMKPGGLSFSSSDSAGDVFAFLDDANFYDANDPNGGYSDVFVWSRSDESIVRASNTVEPYQLVGGNQDSTNARMSVDGRFVTFTSAANNLVEEDSNATSDLFLYDRQEETTKNITAAGDSPPGPGELSDDGSVVVFRSFSGELVAGDDVGSNDIFAFERQSNTLTNLTSEFTDLTIQSLVEPDVSGDGELVLFATAQGLKLLRRATGQLVDLPFSGLRQAQLSGDGRYVLVEQGSEASEQALVVYDIENQQTIASLDASDRMLSGPAISADGRYVVLDSSKPLNPEDVFHGGVYLWEVGNNVYRRLGSGMSDQKGQAISADGAVVVFRTYSRLIPAQPTDPSNCALSAYPAHYSYVVDTGVIERLPCIVQEPGGPAPVTRPYLNGNGSLILSHIRSAYVVTDVSSRKNIFVAGLRGTTPADNTAPVVPDLEFTLVSGQQQLSELVITLNGNDIDGDPLTYQVVDRPVNGSAFQFEPGRVTYRQGFVSGERFIGTDSFTYAASDGITSSNVGLVTINVVAEFEPVFTAVQRSGTRTIDVVATWPAEAHWTQVRVYDGPTAVLWDGQAESWSGTYTAKPDATEVTFNSRYWIAGVEFGNTDVTVVLEGLEPPGFVLEGFSWIDTNGDSIRDSAEPGEVGRRVNLFRCAPPWGIAGSATTQAPDGTFEIIGLDAGEYQMGTPATGVEFSAPGNDNLIYPSGFSNCFTVDGNQPPAGIGLLSADLPRINVDGFAWLDADGDSVRDDSEAPETEREVIMYRCDAPWGIAGRGTTGANGSFVISQVTPGRYQFGTSTAAVSFSPVQRDNLIYENGFSNCVDFSSMPRAVGIGLLP